MDDPRAEIRDLDAEQARRALPDLAELLRACVEAGASVNFVLPFPPEEAHRYWTAKVLPALEAGTRTLLVARAGEKLAGSVQLAADTPPNQPHRADVTKLLVHPDFRRRGIARALMAEIEARALAGRRRLITLDTRSGDSAEPLYRSLGYIALGEIPSYSVDPLDPKKSDAATFFYKELGGAPAS